MIHEQEPSIRVGIDLGGTKTAVGLVSADGRLIARRRLETRSELPLQRLIERIADCVVAMRREVDGGALRGFGVGCAGPVDPQTGRLENPDTLPGWVGDNLLERLRPALNLSDCALDNDANAAVLAEALFGVGRGVTRAFMLTIGTGVGAGFWSEGRLCRGVRDAHPEFGMLPVCVQEDIFLGRSPTLEELASGSGIVNSAKRMGFESSTASDVFLAAADGDNGARRAVDLAERAIEWAGRVIAQTYLPDVIALSGGVINSEFDRYAAALRRGLNQGRLVPFEAIRVERAELGDDSGLIGAAALLDHGVSPELGPGKSSKSPEG